MINVTVMFQSCQHNQPIYFVKRWYCTYFIMPLAFVSYDFQATGMPSQPNVRARRIKLLLDVVSIRDQRSLFPALFLLLGLLNNDDYYQSSLAQCCSSTFCLSILLQQYTPSSGGAGQATDVTGICRQSHVIKQM